MPSPLLRLAGQHASFFLNAAQPSPFVPTAPLSVSWHGHAVLVGLDVGLVVGTPVAHVNGDDGIDRPPRVQALVRVTLVLPHFM